MKRLGLLVIVLALEANPGCATLAGEGKGDVDLPTMLAGPYRALKHGQLCDGDVCTGVDELPANTANGTISAPIARAPTVLVRGGTNVVLYASRGDEGKPENRITRMDATDGRTFGDVVDVVLADRASEGGTVSDPWAIEVNGEVWLYYTVRANGVAGQTPGIFHARSTDSLEGRTFAKDASLALGPEGAKGPWETDAPRAPSVVRAADGSYRMFYASGVAIGEASSPDGVTFTRVGTNPVLVPSTYVDPATLPEGVRPPFDDQAVDDPSAFRVITATDRVLVGLHYTGRDRRGGSSVGYAGRFGDAGTFERKEGFVFGGKLFGDPDGNSHANAPALARFEGFALLYANIDQDRAQKIGVGVAPQRKLLPIE